MFRGIWEFIKEVAGKIWNSIKKAVTKVFSFMKNIVNKFKNLIKTGKLNPQKNEIPIALKEDQISSDIKEKLQSGEYETLDLGLTGGIYTVVYDLETETIKDDTLEIVGYESLDAETKNAFKNNDMLVLK